MTDTTLAKRSPPPKPEVRKDNPIYAEYEAKVKSLLRNAMIQRGIDVEELAARLNEMGIPISPGGLANKISRGGFSSAFLMQCMEAMDTNLIASPR